MLARVAEAFSGKTNERPHEINARIAAIRAYLAAARSAPPESKASLARAAMNEAERLREAAAAIDLRLDDETFALVTKTHELAGNAPDSGMLLAAGAEESLLNFMRREVPGPERLEILARLALALGRIHDMNVKPCGFGPGDVVVRSPSTPVIKSFEGPAAPLREGRAAERAFIAPEILRQYPGADLRADLYVIGALLVAWFGDDPPPNRGFWMPLIRAWKRPLKKFGKPLTGLALELTALDPRNRPQSAAETADRLRQAAVTLSAAKARART
jgi:hypothetical protein